MLAPRIYKDEHDAEAELKDQLEMYNCWVRKLHGSLLQPGLPDFLIATPRSFFFAAENKFWRQVNKPTTIDDFTKLLRPQQRVTIVTNLWPRKVFAPIFAFTPSGVTHLTDGQNIYETTIEGLATYIKDLSCNPLS